MKSKEIVGVPIISISVGTQVGYVKGLVVNPQQKTVEFLLLEDQENNEGIKGIPFRYAEGVGDYAVTIENESVIIEISRIGILQELLEKNINIIGTKVITRKGKYLGEVCDFSIDTETGKLKDIYYQGNNENENNVSIHSVITLGKEVLVVEEQTAAAKADSSEKEIIKETESLAGSQGVAQPTFKKPVVAKTVIEQPVAQPLVDIIEMSVSEEPEEGVITSREAEQNDREKLNSRPAGELDPADAFIQRQRQFLIGKTLLKDFQSKEGEVIAWENEVVTEELFEKAYKIGAQKIMELAMSVRE